MCLAGWLKPDFSISEISRVMCISGSSVVLIVGYTNVIGYFYPINYHKGMYRIVPIFTKRWLVVQTVISLVGLAAASILYGLLISCGGICIQAPLASERATNQKLKSSWAYLTNWAYQIFHLNYYWYKLYLKTSELHFMILSFDRSWF